MGIAILVFFLAIFGGALFLLGLIWFFFIRKRNSRRQSRHLSSDGSMNQDSDFSDDDRENDFADETSAIYSNNSTYTNSRTENINFATSAKAEAEPLTQSENYQHSNHSHASASAELSYSESSFSTSDSSSSYDSGSSDSGSSSSSD